MSGWTLRKNNLMGKIPAELGDLSQLEVLSLPDNQLQGEIPSELGDLTNLTRLWLSGNGLVGKIPPELGNLNNLERMWLTSNQLSGAIPSELGSLANLWLLQLSWNQLTGPIPPEFGNLANLRYLRLSHNRLTGAILEDLSRLTGLIEIELGDNQLSGCLPHKLETQLDPDSTPGVPICPPNPEDFRVPGWLTKDIAESEEPRDALIDRAKRVDAQLEELESPQAFHAGKPDSYAFSLLAIALLESYAGKKSLARFYTLMQEGRTWQKAFRQAFKMPVEEFYFFFEEHRAAGFPEVSTYIEGHPNLIFGPDVDEAFRRQILDDMEVIREWFARDMGIDIAEVVPEGVTGFVFGDGAIEGVKMRRLDAAIACREDLTPAGRERLKDGPIGLGWGLGHHECFLICTCGPVRTRTSLSHEFVHVIQGYLAGGGWPFPTWFTEGTAVHLSRMTAAKRGMEKCNPNLCNGADSFIGYLQAALDYPPLETMETREGMAGLEFPYASGMVASAILGGVGGPPLDDGGLFAGGARL